MNSTRTTTQGQAALDHGRAQRQSVVIIGAGPAGVMLAIELARRGVSVRVLEREQLPHTETRATGIHARTLEIFHQLGLIDEVLELGHKLDGFALHTRRRRPVRVRYRDLDTPYAFMLNLSQAVTQRILDQHLERLGATIERGAAVTDLTQNREHVELSVTRAGRAGEQTLTADWVVGCDGARSIVRTCLGVPFDGEDYGQDWLMAELDLDPAPARDHFHFYARTPAPFVALPLASGKYRIFLPQVPNRAGERQPPDIDEIVRLVAQRGPAGLKLSDPSLLTTFRCARRSAPTLRHGRVLVAGDAAHLHSPAGGQGLNTGLQDSFNLGWKLALVARGESSPALLDTYEGERGPIAAGVLELTHAWVRTLTVATPRGRWLRDRALPAATAIPALRRRFTHRTAQLSDSYRDGPLAAVAHHNGRATHVPGDRLPSVHGLRRDGTVVATLDLIDATAHTLLIFTGNQGSPELVQNLIARFERWRLLVRPVVIARPGTSGARDAVSDPDLRAHRRYHALNGRLLLVRPDGHLAANAPLDRPDIPERYLHHITATNHDPSRRAQTITSPRAHAVP
jgi:2-polyprenyl-6-methoxyphenol hydroxylase-like FAD-dependent oxidoreductase